jgi:hypothetical protein
LQDLILVIAYSPPLYATFNWYQSQTLRKELNRLEKRCLRPGNKVKSLHHRSGEDRNPIVDENASNVETSMTPTVEELMKKLEKLNAKFMKLKTKDKRGKKNASTSEDDNSSYEEKVSNKGKRDNKKLNKFSYNAMSFNYNNMSIFTTYTSIPVGKAPYFDGTNYNQWKHCIKSYLYSISPEVWQVVCNDVDFMKDDEEPTLYQLQKIHHNAQAITILNSSMETVS